MSLLAGQLDEQTIRSILSHYPLGELRGAVRGGGTAGSKAKITTRSGTYLIRRRRQEFSAEPIVRFDHSVLRQLAAIGVGCAVPVATRQGRSWLELAGHVYEITPWLEGDPFDPASTVQLERLGRSLGQLHAAADQLDPEGDKPWRREDDPRELGPKLEATVRALEPGQQRECVAWLQQQLRQVADHLDEASYAALPQCVIHGDIHPGNVKFDLAGRTLFFDFDWCSRQARIRDLGDVLAFFAFVRSSPTNPDDIWSLTAPWTADWQRAQVVWQAYTSIRRVEPAERDALPWLMRSRWIQGHVSGMRKVPPEKRIRFLTRDVAGPLAWLDRRAAAFFSAMGQL